MQVDRYIYFPSCAEKFRRAGASLLERDTEEAPAAGLEVSARVRSPRSAGLLALRIEGASNTGHDGPKKLAVL